MSRKKKESVTVSKWNMQSKFPVLEVNANYLCAEFSLQTPKAQCKKNFSCIDTTALDASIHAC